MLREMTPALHAFATAPVRSFQPFLMQGTEDYQFEGITELHRIEHLNGMLGSTCIHAAAAFETVSNLETTVTEMKQM